MKIEKIFVLVFFGCLLISSITFLTYDHVNEEIHYLDQYSILYNSPDHDSLCKIDFKKIIVTLAKVGATVVVGVVV
ncbi:hypothetical protein NOL15_09245 [Streptococcus suis]|uniref:Uncharacterized protein n=1 Tax=Streptococcus suis TaxID=1307 RepID=A0A9X4RQ46_STRSU|nr:hypothetical protein [Streptococcus suis]